MKVFWLMMALALGALPVNAQLDQQWKQRDAEFTKCRQRYRCLHLVNSASRCFHC